MGTWTAGCVGAGVQGEKEEEGGHSSFMLSVWGKPHIQGGAQGFSGGSVVKNMPAKAAATGEVVKFDPWIRKIPWSRKWQSTPVFLAGNLHGQKSLVGQSPWGHKESDVTEHHIYISNKFPEGDVAGGHGVGGRKAHLRIVDLH